MIIVQQWHHCSWNVWVCYLWWPPMFACLPNNQNPSSEVLENFERVGNLIDEGWKVLLGHWCALYITISRLTLIHRSSVIGEQHVQQQQVFHQQSSITSTGSHQSQVFHFLPDLDQKFSKSENRNQITNDLFKGKAKSTNNFKLGLKPRHKRPRHSKVSFEPRALYAIPS